MSVRTDQVNIRVNISGDKARNELNLLQKKKAELRAEMKGLKKDTQEFATLDKEYKSVTSEVSRLQKEIGLTALTQKELNAQLRLLRSQRSNLVPDTKEFRRVQGEIEQVSKRLREVRTGATGFEGAMNSLGNQMKKFGMIAMSYLGFHFLSSQFKNLIGETAKYIDQLADVRKVTGMTTDSVNELAEALKKIDTRSSNSELREMAVAAGKLGISGKDDLLAFVAAADQINVALGDDLQGSTEEVMKTVGKLVEIFGVSKDFEIGDAILKVGSSMNELTNSSSASAGYIAEFSRRMGGVAPLVNMTIDQVMGLGATLDQLGQTTEVSSTALSKMFIKMASDAESFSKYAGMEVNAFKDLLETDFTGAFVKVLEGVKASSGGVNALAATLGDLGMDAGRVVAVLGTLANNTDILTDQLNLANIAFEDGTSVTEEFMIKNDNFAASVDKLSKSFDNLVTSNEVRGLIQGIMERVIKLVDWLGRSAKWVNENRIGFIALTTALIVQLGWFQRLTKSLAFLVTGIRATTVAQAQMAISQSLLILRTQGLNLVTAIFTGNLQKARTAFIALSAAMRLHPFALVAAAVGAAVIAFNKYTTAINNAHKELNWMREIEREARKEMSESNAVQRIAINVLQDKTATIQSQEKALKNLIDLNPEMLSGLTAENALTAEGTRLRKLYNKQLEESLKLRGVESRIQKHQDRMDELGAWEGDVDFALSGGEGIDLNKLPKDIKDALIQTTRTPMAIDLLSKVFNFTVDKKDQLKALKDILIDEQQKTNAQIDDALGKHTQLENELAKTQMQAVEKNIETIKGTLSGLDDTTKEYKKAEIELKKAEKKLRSMQGIEDENPKKIVGDVDDPIIKNNLNNENDKALEKKLKDLEQLHNKITTVQRQLAQDQARAIDDQEKLNEIEIQQTVDKYAELIAEAERLGVEILTLEGMQEQELQQLRDKHWNDYANKEFQQQRKFLDDYYKKEKEEAQRAFIDGEISLKDYNTRIEGLKRKQAQDEKTLYEDYADNVENAAKRLEDAKTKILEDGVEERKKIKKDEEEDEKDKLEKEILTHSIYSLRRLEAKQELLDLEKQQILDNEELTNEEVEEIEREFANKMRLLKVEYWEDWANLVIGALQMVGTAVSDIADTRNNKEQAVFNEDKKRTRNKEKLLADQLEHGIISREEYDARLAKMNLELDKKEQELREKQAKRQKRAAIFNAIINTAGAVLNGLSTQPFMPVGIAMGALAGILGGVQIAKIASEPVPVGRKGLVLKGPSHESKGISMINNQTGQQIAEVEGGEPVMVLSKNTYRNNKQLIDELIYNSQMKNGAKVGLNDMFYQAQSAFKTSELTPILKDGGYAYANAEMERQHMQELLKYSENLSSANTTSRGAEMEADDTMQEMLNLNIRLYNKFIEMEENKASQKAYVVFQDIKKQDDLYDKVKRSRGFQ